MFLELKIAFRLLFKSKEKKISFLTLSSIIGISIGVFVLLISRGLVSGFEKELNDKLISYSSHIEISQINYESKFEDLEKILKNKFSEIKSISTVYYKEAMLNHGENLEGIEIISYDEEIFSKRFSNFINNKIYLYDSSSGIAEIAIGEKLQKNLNLNINDTSYIISNSNDEDVILVATKVIGSLNSGIKEFDETVVFTSKYNMFTIFGESNLNKTIEIECFDKTQIENLKNKINSDFNDKFIVKTVYEKHKNIFEWIDLQKKTSPIFMILLLVVSIFSLISFILTSILEKKYTLGVLQTLGLNYFQTKKIFLFKAMLIVTISILIGITFTFIFDFLQYNYQIIKLPSEVYIIDKAIINLNYFDFIYVTLITYFVSILFTIIPVWNSKIITPIEIIK